MENERDEIIAIVTGDLEVMIERWRRSPDAGLFREAMEILAVWAHLHRFGKPKPEALDALEPIVTGDMTRLCLLAPQNDSPEAWLDALERLAEAAPDALPGVEMDACADAAMDLFRRLDQAQLASWAMLPSDEPAALDLARRWVCCDRAFYEKITEFLAIRMYAERISVHYDPAGFDDDLRFITEKYYRVAEEAALADFDREPSRDERCHVARILPSTRRMAERVVRFIDEARKRSSIALAADSGGPERPVENHVGITGGTWSADMVIRKDKAVVFVRDNEGMPFDDGTVSIGNVSEMICDGKAVFPLNDVGNAIAAGEKPALMKGDAVFPGNWEMENGDGA